MKKRTIFIIFTLLLVAGQASGQACTISGLTASTSMCKGGSVGLSVTGSGGTGPYTYQWQYSADGSTGWANVSTGTPAGITYSGGGTSSLSITGSGSEAAGNMYYNCIVQATTGCGPTTSTVATVTINDDPSWNSYSLPSPTSLCEGGSVSFSVSVSGGLGGTITWIRSNAPGGAGTTVTTGDTPAAGTWYYRPSYAPTGTGCNLADGTETTVTVSADPGWTGYSLPSPTSLCEGGSVSFSVSVTGGLGGSITWLRSASPGGAGTTVTTGDTPAAGTWYYRPTYAPTGTGCNLADGTETTVTVATDPSWTGYSLPSPTSLCEGGSVSFSVSVSGGLGGTITWIRSNAPGGAGTTVTTGDTPAAGTWYYRPSYAPTGTGCNLADGTETTVTVSADPGWTGYSLPSPTSLCEGGSVSFSVSVTGGLGGSITWLRSASPGGAGTTVTTGDTPAAGTWYYRPTYAPTGTGCNLADGTETTVTVATDPSWTGYSLPSPTSLCVGGSVSFSVSVTGGLGGSITWLRSASPGGAGTTVTTGDIPAAGTWYYRPTYAPTGTGCNLADGTETTVTVIPTVGTPSAPSGTSPVCQASGPSAFTTLASNATSYTWTVTSPNIISGTGTTGTVTWDAGFSGPATVSVTANGCGTSTPASTIITVNPLTEDPIFTAGATTLCINPPDETYTATAVNSTSIAYSVVPSGFGSGQAGVIDINTGVMNYKSTFSGTATITATATGLCGTTITSRVVTVYPSAPSTPGTITGSSPVCQGQTDVIYSISAVSNATNYVWAAPAGATITSGQGTTSITVNFSAAATSPLDITVRAQNNCGLSGTRTKSVIVSPTPTATISGTTSVCQGALAPTVTFNNPQSLAVTITYNINGSGQTTINVPGAANATVTAPTGTAGTFIYTLVSVAYQTGAICSNNITGTATVTVTPTVGTPTAITVSAGSDPTCQLTDGSTTTTYTTTASNSTSFNWSLSNVSAGSINSSGLMTWANGFSGNVDIRVTATGCGTSSMVTRPVSITPAVGTPAAITISAGSDPTCQLANGTTTTTYTTSASNSTGFNWSLSNSAAGSINPTSGLMNWANGFSGSVNIQVTANGCGISSQVTRTVNVTPNVGTPTAITVSAGSDPTCQLTNGTTTTTYTTTAANSTAFTWSLSNPSAGTIDPLTGIMTWTNGFSGNVNIQVYATGCNGNSTQVIRAVTVTPAPGTPTAITVSAGSDPSCQLTDGTTMTIYSTTATNSTGFNWSVSNPSAGSINATSGVMNWTNGFSGSVNIQVTASGCGTSSQVVRTVLVNPLPVPTNTGPSSPRVTSIGNLYSTESGMNNYIWSVSSGGSVTAGGTSASNSVTVTWNTTGAESVSVRYTNSNNCTALAPTTNYVTVNPLPSVSNVLVSGTPAIGYTLTGTYSYNDGSTGSDNCTFRWLRNGTTPISGATLSNYLVQAADVNNTLTFEVTPVSSSGFPNTGIAVKSSATIPVENLLEIPIADQVCIEGVRTAGNILRGKYRFTHSKPEGTSTYKWYIDGVAIPSATSTQYTLLASDIDGDEEITFEVTPVSSNVIPATGVPANSGPMAKIPLVPTDYSVAVSSVPLTASPTGGIFSGPGVTNGIFSPSSVGIAGSPYSLQYQLNIINSSTSCSQTVWKTVNVVSNTTEFTSFKDVYCQTEDPDEIVVTGLLIGATSVGFYLTDADAIVSSTDWTVTIDPKKMRPGNNIDYLYFRYKDFRGYEYQISKSFVIDSVGTGLQIINLNNEYCEETPKVNISVSGTYPSGGTGVWTSSILSDLSATAASVDVSLVTAGPTYPLSYRYTSPLGCNSIVLNRSVTVNPLPNPSFSIAPFYNIDGEAATLVPVQTSGTFSGNGISGDKLYPDIAGLGEHTINYFIKDGKGCFDDLDIKTTIKKAQGTFTDIPAIICYRDTIFNVKVTGLPAGMSVNSFVNSRNSIDHIVGATDANYSVKAAGHGLDTLTLSYKLDGVDYWVTKVVNIDSLGLVQIQNLLTGDKVCDNRAPFELFTSMPGGVFTGPVAGNYLDPTKATGATSVLYKYTNSRTGCSTSTTVPFSIIPAPQVSFLPKDVCIESNKDSTFFLNTTVTSDPVYEWTWTFAEIGAAPSNRKEPAFLYKTGGIHSVSLNVRTVSGCTVTKTASIDLGIRPIADFTWKNDCFAPGAKLNLSDATFTNFPVTSRTWNFNNGSLISSDLNPEYALQDTGYVQVKYIVRTSYANCADTVSRKIYLRPTITIPQDGFYYQNFEAGKAGWGKDDSDPNLIWSFGTPDRTKINKAKSGATAWYTRYESDKQGKTDTTSVISPCFDFTNIQRPMITLQAFKIFDKNRNGAALQYKTEESGWKYVGTLDDGINWYNSTLINGKPGGEKIGWTTLSEEDADIDYVPSSHALDELKGLKNVKFRLAYGSDGNSLDKEGIAFDDIWIGERTRKVLLEHFTNTFSKKGSEATAFINKIIKVRGKDVINIQYHTNFPDDDPFYLANPGDASARIFSYGLSKVPYSLIDGGYSNEIYASLSDYKVAPLDSNDLSRRTLLDSKFAISLTPDVIGGVLTVNSTVTAGNAFTSDNLVLYLVVTEKEALSDKPAALGEVTFKNVFRKFIPDAGGIDLRKIWTKGDTFTIPEKTWVIENIKNNTDIEVIAFIQNSQTKEVYQVTSSSLKTGKSFFDKSNLNENSVGTENNLLPVIITFGLYPNPAADKLRIEFSDKLVSETDIRIFDFQGAVKKSYKVASGESDFFIEDLGLKAGIYLVRISSGGVDLGFRKLIITGD